MNLTDVITSYIGIDSDPSDVLDNMLNSDNSTS